MNRADRRNLAKQQRRASRAAGHGGRAGMSPTVLKLTALAVSSDRPLGPDAVARIMDKDYAALETLMRGKAPDQAAWDMLANAASWVRTLGMRGNADPHELAPIVNPALRALRDAMNRSRAGKGMRFDAAGLQAMHDVLDAKRQALEGLSERVVSMVEIETAQRLAQVDAAVSVAARAAQSVGAAGGGA